ncbi:unnamed protein product [Durusdinium trenchii]|uniref:Uncharacterized protein n=1 Tax=Durusdinium trenchii TaxID=1381693 RepID=A0ABP0NQK3_9DINO
MIKDPKMAVRPKISIASLRMMSHTSLLAQCSSTFGIFLPMVLMFVVVMLPPASIFSFAVLLLFVAMAAVEQFGLHRFHSTVLMLTCLVAAIQLPFRFVVMLPSIKAFIQEHLPKADYKVLWEAFALDMDGEDARRKLMLMVALMLVSSFLCRGYKFWRGEGSLETVEWNEAWAEALREKLRGREGYIIQDQHGLRLDLSELNQVTPEQFPLKLTFPAEDQFKITEESCPRLVILLRAAASWSEALMILVSYFLLLSTDLLTRFQLLALTALLSSGRGWSYVGGLVSVSAMASLLIQYLFRFDFVQVSDQAEHQWCQLGERGVKIVQCRTSAVTRQPG